MESIRKIFKWIKGVPAFFWGVAVAIVAGIGLWLEIRGRETAEEIRREIDRDKAESDDLVARGDTAGMRDKWLDKDNWK